MRSCYIGIALLYNSPLSYISYMYCSSYARTIIQYHWSRHTGPLRQSHESAISSSGASTQLHHSQPCVCKNVCAPVPPNPMWSSGSADGSQRSPCRSRVAERTGSQASHPRARTSLPHSAALKKTGFVIHCEPPTSAPSARRRGGRRWKRQSCAGHRRERGRTCCCCPSPAPGPASASARHRPRR